MQGGAVTNKTASEVDIWLTRETDHVRKALENASRHFDKNDKLTVNTLESVYAQESSFGLPKQLSKDKRGVKVAAGHFQHEAPTARRYGLTVTKTNDQRFDIDYASSAGARYLKDLDTFFSKDTFLVRGRSTIGVKNPVERKKFTLAAYNKGEGRIAKAQNLAKKAGLDPTQWDNVKDFLEKAGATKKQADEARHYVVAVLSNESEFAKKSTANKKLKHKKEKKIRNRCTDGHWITKDDRPIFICD